MEIINNAGLKSPFDKIIESIDLISMIKEKGELIKSEQNCKLYELSDTVFKNYYLFESSATHPEVFFCERNLLNIQEIVEYTWKLFLEKQPKSQNIINLTDLEIQFIRRAINLKEYVLPFNDLNDKTFEEDFGYTKDELNDVIDSLKNKINSIL